MTYARVWRQSAAIVAISKYIGARLEALGAPRAKIHVLPIGVLPSSRTLVPYTARPPSVLFVGRLVEKKGCRDLIEAIGTIGAERRPAVMVVGDGPLRPSLEALAKRLGVEAKFTGTLPPDKVRHEMGMAAIFCAPSRVAESGDAEGFGLVFLEAAAEGTPVVSYRSGGVPEAVEDGATGILCAEGAVPQLASAIEHLLADRDVAARMGDSGRRRVERHFDIRERTKKLEGLYDEVASGTRRRPDVDL